MATLYCYGCTPEHLTTLRTIAQQMRYDVVDLPSLDALPERLDAGTRFAVQFSAIFNLLTRLTQHPDGADTSILAILPAGFRRDVDSEAVQGHSIVYVPEDQLGAAQRELEQLPT